MQPSDTQILGLGAAAATGLAGVYAVLDPNPLSITACVTCASAWGMAAFVLSRRSKAAAFRATELVLPAAGLDGDRLRVRPTAPTAELVTVHYAGLGQPTTSQSVGDVAVELTGTLAGTAGTLDVLCQRLEAGQVAVSCEGAISPEGKHALEQAMLPFGQESTPRPLQANRGRGLTDRNDHGCVQFLGFSVESGRPEAEVDLSGPQRLLRAVEQNYGARVVEANLRCSHLRGRFDGGGHAVLIFEQFAQVQAFLAQFMRLSDVIRRAGWRVTELNPAG